MDLGDKNHEVCLLDQEGNMIDHFTVGNTRRQLRKVFAQYKGALVAMETGTHSPWISRELEALGCRVLVGNARKLRAIWARSQKTDVKDAEMLARIARFDRQLLYPIRHRSRQKQIGSTIYVVRSKASGNAYRLVVPIPSTSGPKHSCPIACVVL
jgi:transposase